MTAPAASPATVSASFTVLGDLCPQLLSRVIAHFAQLNLVPSAIRAEQREGGLMVAIEQPGLSAHQAEVIAEKIRSIVTVTSVALGYRTIGAIEIAAVP